MLKANFPFVASLPVVTATQLGIPIPGFSSALSYYDALRTERLPAALIQGLRDFFGAHTYSRTDADKDDALVHLLRENPGLAVVYAATRKAVERIAMLLERSNVSAAAYHAGSSALGMASCQRTGALLGTATSGPLPTNARTTPAVAIAAVRRFSLRVSLCGRRGTLRMSIDGAPQG